MFQSFSLYMHLLQIIPTDDVPVSVEYLKQLDQVWVVCWNKLIDDSTKTVLVIRNASRPAQHHTVHVPGIGNRFDLVNTNISINIS